MIQIHGAPPLWGQGGDFILFEKIISDVPGVGVNTHGDVTRVGAEKSGDVTRGGAEESGDVPTQSPQGVVHLEFEWHIMSS